MKKSRIKCSMIVSSIALGLILAFFVFFYSSTEQAFQSQGSDHVVPIYSTKIKPLSQRITGDREAMMSHGLYEDPMYMVDTSVDVYRVVESVKLRERPLDETYYTSIARGESIMVRGEQDGWYHVQLPSGRLGFLDGLDGLELIGHERCGVTRIKMIPKDATPYVVGEGDRVLRYRAAPELTHNASDIVDIGTTVYAMSNNYQYFRVILPDGRTGYINSQCLDPKNPEGYESHLGIVDGGRTIYDYQEMMDDIVLLIQKYPQYLRLYDVGESELGRAIPVMLLGREDAEHKVLVQASIHGREFVTTQILMKQLEVMLYHLDVPNSAGYTYGSILDDVAYYIIPMSNPDGCMISIMGELSVTDYDDRQKLLAIRDANVSPEDEEIYNNYFRMWKANYNGVDLNRNFDPNWQKVTDQTDGPANVNHKGSAPFNQKESRFLKEYVDREDVSITVSYHTSGALVFWWYHQEDKLETLNYDLANLVYRCSGYPIMGKRESYGSHGGMKDYGIVLGKPSVTVEMGYYSTPIPPSDCIEVMEKTSRLLPRLGSWLRMQLRYNNMQ